MEKGQGCAFCGLPEQDHETRTRDGKLYTGKQSYSASVREGLHEFVSQRNLPVEQQR